VKCYIVRIYREDKENEFAGVVEKVGTAGEERFATFGELCEILDPGKGRFSGKRMKKHSNSDPSGLEG